MQQDVRIAHAMGFIPEDQRDVSEVPGTSIMGLNLVVVTTKARLHAKSLYKQPTRSSSPDRNLPGVTIN